VNLAKRQKVLLGVLGVLLLMTVWRYFLSPLLAGGGDPAPEARRIGGTVSEEGGAPAASPRVLPGARAGSRPVASDVPTDRALDLDVAALQAKPHTYTPGRDPWRFGAIPPPPPTPEEIAARKQAEAIAAQQRAAEEAARKVAEQQALNPPPPPPPQPPPFTLRYLGSFGPPRARIAVFSDGKTIYNVREGGVIQGKFVVAHIGFESVDIQFVGFPDTPAQRLSPGR
jgi:hypothetical protein